MAAFAEPWLLLLTCKDGRKRVLVETGRTAEISLQLGHILRADRRNLEVIDAAGNYFQRAAGSIAGIDWGIFRHAWLVAPFVLPFQLFFPWTAMVRVRIECAEPPTQLSLLEIKGEVREAILGNPRMYTWAPPEEIVGRVNVARTIPSLMKSIYRD